jgi:hypothetical protein
VRCVRELNSGNGEVVSKANLKKGNIKICRKIKKEAYHQKQRYVIDYSKYMNVSVFQLCLFYLTWRVR